VVAAVPSMLRPDDFAPHTLDAATVLERLQSSEAGLGSAEVERRRTQHGPNALQAAPTVSPWSLLAAQFKNVLIVILLASTPWPSTWCPAT
jgi:P-type Ca2+ transporter type 2C